MNIPVALAVVVAPSLKPPLVVPVDATGVAKLSPSPAAGAVVPLVVVWPKPNPPVVAVGAGWVPRENPAVGAAAEMEREN